MELISLDKIQNRIFTTIGVQVMLDSDLASLYQTETKFINRAVKRNPMRFPESFAFQLSKQEREGLRFQNGTLNDEISSSLTNQIESKGWTKLKIQIGTSRAYSSVAFFATTNENGKNFPVKLYTGSNYLKRIDHNSTMTKSYFSPLTSIQ